MDSQWVLRSEEEGPAPVGLGERIRQLRKEVGWSQAELGEKIGTDSQRVSRYENGRITPSLDAIVRVAEAFNVSIDYLLVDGIPRRPLHAAEHNLGDRLSHLGELSEEDLAALLNVMDAMVAKARLRSLAGGIS
ncbi:MAG TPA: helix-turn-helix transcriptional regulator [Solirubrobacteraceae bacterium]|nr:helix-turn-helix transcriptional regulator [Solirubrobacteraceae bacterium]